jgi:hypothetical protein
VSRLCPVQRSTAEPPILDWSKNFAAMVQARESCALRHRAPRGDADPPRARENRRQSGRGGAAPRHPPSAALQQNEALRPRCVRKSDRPCRGNGQRGVPNSAKNLAITVTSQSPCHFAAYRGFPPNELLREIEDLGTADDAALWAQRRLAAKNQLSPADAQHVEEAFAAKLAILPAQSAQNGDAPMPPSNQSPMPPSNQSMADKIRTLLIDKSGLVFPEPRRLRDRDHIRYVMKQPCLVCGRRPADAHHLRFAQSRALAAG